MVTPEHKYHYDKFVKWHKAIDKYTAKLQRAKRKAKKHERKLKALEDKG